MLYRHTLIYLLSFWGVVVASPINNHSDTMRRDAEHEHAGNTKAFFGIVGLLSGLLVLMVVKCYYVSRSRSQAQIIMVNMRKLPRSQCSSAYYDPFSIDSYCQSSRSPSLLVASGSADAKPGLDARTKIGAVEKTTFSERIVHSGIIVGLLGSPSLETTLRVEMDIAVWRQRQSLLLASQVQAPSLRPPSQAYMHQPSTSTNNKTSPNPSRLIKAHLQASPLKHSRSSSLKLPTHARDHRPRRRSLPARGWKRTAPINSDSSSSRKDSGSSSSTGKRKASDGSTATTATSTQALPHEVPPVPNPQQALVKIASSPMFLSNPFPPRFKSSKSPKTSPTLVHPQPLPLVASFDPFSCEAGATSTNIPLSPSPIKMQISYPTPLRPKATTLDDVEPITMEGRSRDSQLYMEILPVIRPLDVSVNVTTPDNAKPEPKLLPVSRNVLSLMHDVSSSNFKSSGASQAQQSSPPPLQTSPPLSSVPAFAQKAIFSKQKPRTRQRSRSSQRSVSLGPSPLRSMILPDASSSSDIGSLRMKGKENASPNPQDVRSSGFGEFGNLPAGTRGMMHPYNNPDSTSKSQLRVQFRTQDTPSAQAHFEAYHSHHAQKQQAQTEQESLRASANAEMASQALRNIIQAVDSASGSGKIQTKRGSTHSKESRNSAKRSSKSWDSSREAIDLGLLGLDRFKWNTGSSHISEGTEDETEETSCGDGNGKSDSEIDFASFWEEARIIEDIERRRSIGMAW